MNRVDNYEHFLALPHMSLLPLFGKSSSVQVLTGGGVSPLRRPEYFYCPRPLAISLKLSSTDNHHGVPRSRESTAQGAETADSTFQGSGALASDLQSLERHESQGASGAAVRPPSSVL